MEPQSFHLVTEGGDVVLMHRFEHRVLPPTVLITIDDVNRSKVPTASLSLDEGRTLSNMLDQLCGGDEGCSTRMNS
jgi:hypothetical protein